MIRNILQKALILLFSIGLSGCNGLFELYPQDELLEKDFWQTEEDVNSAVINCYYNLRLCQDEMIIYGLGRSDITRSSLSEIRNIQRGVFTSTYKVCYWGRWYSLIQAANLVLKKSEAVKDIDAGFSDDRCNELLGEARFMRAFAYFNLIRMWKNVPIVTEPSLNDAQDYFPHLSKNPEEVYRLIEEDLDFATQHMVSNYFDDDNGEVITRARATKGAAYALYSDVLLWQNKYEECIKACDMVINSPLYEMLPSEQWWDIFNPQKGNTTEAIFELNYDDDFDFNSRRSASRYGSSFDLWFKNYMSALNQLSVNWPYPDIRYYTLTGVNGNIVRKHVGVDLSGSSIISENINPNWIIYRLPHVLFNKLEAMNRHLGSSALPEINATVRKIENRAGIIDYEPITGGVGEIEEKILSYKLKETCFEGTRWFDLVRLGRRQWAENKTGDDNILVRSITEIMADEDRIFVKGNLNNPEAWYLPIHESEILGNPNIEQNPFYNNL